MKQLSRKIRREFAKWLDEPSYSGTCNGDHLNTRTTDIANVAFNAGWDAAVRAIAKRVKAEDVLGTGCGWLVPKLIMSFIPKRRH